MPIQYINTGTGANKGNGDTLRLAFTKINQNFALLNNNSKDIVGEVISNPANQSGISVTYSQLTQEASFILNIAGPNTFGGVRIGSGIALNTSTGLISVFDGNYNNLANIPQALGTTDTPTFANLHITGNVDIAGTSTIINSTVVTTDDLTLTLANNSVSQGASHGAGIIVNGPTVPASITYNGTTDSWAANKTFTAPNISISGNNVVTANQLGNITFSTNVISTRNAGEDLVLTPNSTGTLVLNKLNTINVASTIYQGTAYDSVEYSDTSIRVDADVNSYAQMIMKNHSAGLNASTDLVIMNDQGDSFNNIIDLGINSSGYSQTAYGVTQPGDGYLFTNGGNLVLGTQSLNKSIIFHAGGTTIDNAGGSLTQYAWTFNRRVTVSVNSPARLDFLVQNTSNNVEASAYIEAQNDLNDFIKVGVNSSQRVDGNILQGESFIYSSAETGTLHIGNHSAINFYTNPYSGYAGTATLRLETITGNAILDGNFLPYEDETYDLGDTTSTWRTLYLSTTSNISFGDNQLAVDIAGEVTVNDTPILGSLSITGAIITSKDTYGPLQILGNGVYRNASIVFYPESNDIESFGNFVSGGADTFSLGSPVNHWRAIYAGTGGIQFSDGSAILSANGLGGGNATVVVNSTGTVANTGTLWYDTVGGRLYVGYDDTFVDASPAPVLDLSTITQHILPGADLTYDLGSPSHQWRSLYVGTSTVYLGGVPLSITGSELTVNGTPLVTDNHSGDTTIHGNQHITGNLQVDGVFTFTGTATVISVSSATFYGNANGFGAFYAGVVGYTPLPVTVMQATADYNDYAQNNFQNLNPGAAASTEWVATADNGDDTNNYIDMGIASSVWDGSQSNSVGTAAGINDSWIYVQGNTANSQGGNLIVGTIKDGKAVKVLAGSNGASSIVAEFDAGGLTLSSGSAITFSDGSVQTSAVSSTGTVVLQTLNVTSLSATSITLNGTPITGERGYTGSVGTGYVGSHGSNGYTGSAGANGSNGYTGSAGANGATGSFNGSTSAQVQFTNATASTSTTTGALVVTGGVGVGGTVTANKFVGDGSSLTNVTVNVAGNILGTGTNVSLVAGSYTYTFDNAGTLTMPANGDIVMTGTNATIQTGGAITAGYNSPSGGTAFIAGNAAVNNIALGYQPTSGAANMAIRDLSTVSTYMYFDAASNTTSTASQFVFRSSSAYTTWAKIDQYGVNQPTRPAFRVYGAGTTNNLTTTANTNGILNSNNFAVDYQQGTALTTSTGIFTAPVAGLYSVHLVARVSNTSSAQIAVVKNYATTNAIQAMWECGANCTANHFGVSSIVKLAAGDTLVIKVLLGQINFDANDSWAVAYIG